LAPGRRARREREIETQRKAYLEGDAIGGDIEVGLVHELTDGLDELLE